MKFLLVIGNSKIAEIPGLTVAGSSADLIKYTPVADAEFLYYDIPRTINEIPVTPEGHPTPGLITKALNRILKIPVIVIRSGTIIEPSIPFIQITPNQGRNITLEPGVIDLNEIEERARILANNIGSKGEPIMIGESIPGGTTTAMAVLNALGFDSITSSSSDSNPVQLKKEIVGRAIARLRDKYGMKNLDKRTVSVEVSDPVLSFISSFINNYSGEVILAGGTQMLAVYAMSSREDDVRIYTTKYVAEDPSASFKKTANELGVRFEKTHTDLSFSRFKGIRDYEHGIVKEGVGAGGFLVQAEKLGIGEQNIINYIDEAYENVIAAKK